MLRPCLPIVYALGFSQLLAFPPACPPLPSAPVPIRFHLDHPGFVTLVIDDPDGRRVRNLVSETEFSAGEHTVYWDCLDDLLPDSNAAEHGIFRVSGRFVPPGSYIVRGLVHSPIDLTYELTPNTNGHPPWRTSSPTSEWLANHSPPSCVLFVPADQAPLWGGGAGAGVPQIVVGSAVTEGGSAIAWLDLNGQKLSGRMWLGGVWTGASQLARDAGPMALPGVYAYAGTIFQSRLRLSALCNPAAPASTLGHFPVGPAGDRPVLDSCLELSLPAEDQNEGAALTGLAAFNGTLVVSVQALNRLFLIDASARRVLGCVAVEDPRGAAFDNTGRLLVVSGRRVLATDGSRGATGAGFGAFHPFITEGLQDPRGILVDAKSRIFLTDWGASHQVKVFGADGAYERSIGTAGPPGVGPYDAGQMNWPYGLAIDGRGRLWVAERSYAPKRLSVWTPDGRLVNAFFGPSQYGGGGTIDPEDETRFFYGDKGGGQEFKLDFEHHLSWPVAVYYRPTLSPLPEKWAGVPETPLHRDRRTYLTDCYTKDATSGSPVVSIWLLEHGIARPVAVVGRCESAQGPAAAGSADTMFCWVDRNGNGRVDDGEVTFRPGRAGNLAVMPDFTMVGSEGMILRPDRFTGRGVPVYELDRAVFPPIQTQPSPSSGGNQAIIDRDGRLVLTTAPKPFSSFGFGGFFQGRPTWFYPSHWPGLHASHHAPLQTLPGETIGTTRLLGPPIELPDRAAGEIWAINGNKGNVYLLTTDGLFVATLFQDSRVRAWDAPHDRPGMPVGQYSLGEETFFPTLTQTKDGKVYLQGGFYSQLARVRGLESVHRLPDEGLTVDAASLRAAHAGLGRPRAIGQTSPILLIPIIPDHGPGQPAVQGWPWERWATIDSRSTAGREIRTESSLAVVGGSLCVAVRTDDPSLLENSGIPPIFRSGGGIDIMLGSNPDANLGREAAGVGDERLVVAKVRGRTLAVLYEEVTDGARGASVDFSSPIRSVIIDRTTDVTAFVTLASERPEGGQGASVTYRISIPLSTLGLRPVPGRVIRGDIGVLRGNGQQTLQRAYWCNKASGLVSDVSSEAELTPAEWGLWQFKAASQAN